MYSQPTELLSANMLPTTQVSEPLPSEGETHSRLLSEVIVPRASSTREIAVLETAMAGLALDDRHPVALELAASATSRQFLLRATSTTAQQHLTNQVQARYPQALIQKVEAENDPLIQKEDEAVSVVELRAGAAVYLPLRTWRERELLHEGADPLLGVLARVCKLLLGSDPSLK